MSSIQNIRIPVGNGAYESVPQWSTEETLRDILSLMSQNKNLDVASIKLLKQIVLNTTTASGPNSAQGRMNKLLNDVDKLVSNVSENTKKQTKEVKDLVVDLNNEKKSFFKKTQEISQHIFEGMVERYQITGKREQARLAERLVFSFTKSTNEQFRNLVKSSLFGGSFQQIGKSLFGLAGKTMGQIGELGGMVLDEYFKTLIELTNVGSGFGTSLDDFRKNAANLGVSLENYTQLITKNSNALSGFGDNMTDASVKFGIFSNSLVKGSNSFLRNLNMTNTELNQYLLDEIELRRKSGESQQQIENSIRNTFEDLMFQTSALSALTGADRRELQRSRIEQSKNDATLANAISQLSMVSDDAAKNIPAMQNAILAMFGPEFGNQLSKAFILSTATGVDYMALLDENMRTAIQLSPQSVQSSIRDMFSLFQTGYDTMDSTQLQSEIIVLSKAFANLTTQERIQLQTISATNQRVSSSAQALLAATNQATIATSNFGGNVQDVSDQIKRAMQNIQETPGVIGSKEAAEAELKAKLLSEALGLLGIDSENVTKNLENFYETLYKNLTDPDKGIIAALTDSFSELNVELQNTIKILGGLAAVTAGLSTLFGLMSMAAFAKVFFPRTFNAVSRFAGWATGGPRPATPGGGPRPATPGGGTTGGPRPATPGGGTTGGPRPATPGGGPSPTNRTLFERLFNNKYARFTFDNRFMRMLQRWSTPIASALLFYDFYKLYQRGALSPEEKMKLAEEGAFVDNIDHNYGGVTQESIDYYSESRRKRQESIDRSTLYYGDTNPLINRMIGDYTTDKEGFLLSPADVRNKLYSSNIPLSGISHSIQELIDMSQTKPLSIKMADDALKQTMDALREEERINNQSLKETLENGFRKLIEAVNNQ